MRSEGENILEHGAFSSRRRHPNTEPRDHVTGGLTRQGFEDVLAAALSEARAHRRSAAALWIDVDGFRLVNDGLGHAAGDVVLGEVARRLEAATRPGDAVARVGADEFVVLLSDLPARGSDDSADDAMLIAEAMATSIRELLGRPIHAAGSRISVSASIGIALFPDGGSAPPDLMRNAHTAMRASKREGPGGHVVFDPVPGLDAPAAVTIARLRAAVDREEWELHYQPVVELVRGRTVGVEALLRWRDPIEGLIPPGAFLPVAEDTGLSRPIARWVLDRVAQDAERWRSLGLRLDVAVNLSPRQLGDPSVRERLVRWAPGAPASRLIVEVTEAAVASETAPTAQLLSRLRERGIRIAVDDFGTGYSSLARLRHLPVDIVKIDRSFLRDLPDDAGSGTVVRAVIQLAHGLGMVPVAEGIERPAQRRFLVDEGCRLGQGFLFRAPAPLDEIFRAFDADAAMRGTTPPHV